MTTPDDALPLLEEARGHLAQLGRLDAALALLDGRDAATLLPAQLVLGGGPGDSIHLPVSVAEAAARLRLDAAHHRRSARLWLRRALAAVEAGLAPPVGEEA